MMKRNAQKITLNMAASSLPDELWRTILQLGVEGRHLTYKDLCCLSISSRRLHRLSREASLWSSLLLSDFPIQSRDPPSPTSPKALYKIRYEKYRAGKAAAHRRAVLRVESRIAEHLKRIRDLEANKAEENHKIKATFLELSDMHKARQASVAMNVWQPAMVRAKHKEIVEQCPVSVESRINAVEMEVKLCRQQMAVLDKAYRDEKHRLAAAKEMLTSLQYHPLRDVSETGSLAGISAVNINRKKLKRCRSGIMCFPTDDNLC